MNTLFKLNNYVVIDLFEIELESNEGYLRFHGSKNFNKNLIFQNKEYIFIPCEFSQFETTSDGRQGRPKIKIGNVNNYFSDFCICNYINIRNLLNFDLSTNPLTDF